MSYNVWDLETGIKVLNKRKGSPFHPENKVIVNAFKRPTMAAPQTDHFGKAGASGSWFRDQLAGTKMLVGFNIKFDLLHALRDADNYTAWMDWVVAGGRIWDCQLAEYLIHGMAREHQILSLDETAPRYGGVVKNDAIAALWDAGVETYDIDKDMLLEYAVGDIENTEKIFLGQVAALRARGGLNSALLNMDGLLATVEMERNGMHVDKELGIRLAAVIEQKIKELATQLDANLPADLPFQFNWGSRWHLSPLIFGGVVRYDARVNILDEHGNLTYVKKKERQYILNDGSMTAVAPADAPDPFVYATYAGGKNKGEFKTKMVDVPDIARGPKSRMEKVEYTFPRLTEPDPKWESSTEGLYSVASEIIQALAGRGIPFLDDIATMAAMQKDLGTYFITTDEDTGEQKGMLTLVGDDNLIHHSLHMVRTLTARLSSSDPNLQNVSGAGKSDVKSVFTSRYGADGRIIQSDFTALEIYVQAILTQCRTLIEDLKLGLDMHINRVAAKTGRTYDDVMAEYVAEQADQTGKPRPITKQRKGAKEFSFQRAYGAGVKKIAETTGMSEEDVEALVEAEALRYPEIDAFYIQVTNTISNNRVPTNRHVNHPDVPGLVCQLGRSHYVTPDGKLYSYSEQPSPEWIAKKPASKGGTPQSFSPTEIKNYIVQGTGGEWAKAAMALAVRAYYAHKNFGGRAVLVNQVHDALYADAAREAEVQAAALLQACMDEANAYMEHLFRWRVPVAVPAVTKSGPSMIEENDIPEGFNEYVTAYRKWVRDHLISPGYVPTYEKEEHNG